MVNYSLIIEYHQKGNNNTQVAASKASASHDRAALCGFRPEKIAGRIVSRRFGPAAPRNQK